MLRVEIGGMQESALEKRSRSSPPSAARKHRGKGSTNVARLKDLEHAEARHTSKSSDRAFVVANSRMSGMSASVSTR